MRASVPTILPVERTAPSVMERLNGLFDKIEFAWQVRRERDQLRGLDDHMLKDLGLDRGQVEAEVSRSLFDLPRKRRSFGR